MTKSTADAVVIGGGVAGSATAYYLAKAGMQSVIVERDAIASHASGYAYGGLMPLTGAGIPGPMFPLAQKAFGLHMALAGALPHESGIDFEFRARPHLSLAFTQDEARQIQADLEWMHRQPGFSAQWISGDDVRRIDARISSAVVGAGVIQGMAELEPRKFTQALARASGAAVRIGVATGLVRDGDRVTGVTLADGSIACETVVLAQGPWLGEAANWLDTTIDVAPLKGQIVRLDAPGPPLDCSIGWSGNYATTKKDGLLWAGTTEEAVGFDDATTADGCRSILSVLRRMMPSLADASIAEQTACLRPMSPDGHAVLGRAPGWRGVYIGGGGGRKGILYGPAMGATLVDLIANKALDLDITPYDPGRFGHPSA